MQVSNETNYWILLENGFFCLFENLMLLSAGWYPEFSFESAQPRLAGEILHFQ